MSMQPKLGETVTYDFVTNDATGAAADADTTPTCAVFEDANDTPILAPAVIARAGTTGHYRVQVACTTGNGFEANKSYNVVAAATVGGVAGSKCLDSFQVRAYVLADVQALVALALALAGQNSGVRDQVYDSASNLTSCSLFAYDSALHAALNDGATGVVHEWAMAFTYVGGRQATQSLSQVS